MHSSVGWVMKLIQLMSFAIQPFVIPILRAAHLALITIQLSLLLIRCDLSPGDR
jgi:hypothetical protein